MRFYSGSQGCVEGGQYCEEHQRLAAQQYNKHTRSPDTNKKYGRAWKRYATATPPLIFARCALRKDG